MTWPEFNRSLTTASTETMRSALIKNASQSMSVLPKKILFVCLGNICRSPLAQGIFEHRLTAHGMDHVIHLDSAGTAGYHIGKAPDPRARAAAKAAGFNIDGQRARQVALSDLEMFDLVFAMDQSNHHALMDLATPDLQPKIQLVMSLVEPSSPEFGVDVPDPYYGEADGFRRVVSMLDQAVTGWIQHYGSHLRR